MYYPYGNELHGNPPRRGEAVTQPGVFSTITQPPYSRAY
jgi:hypothetical protein